jgi:hypothetical protein
MLGFNNIMRRISFRVGGFCRGIRVQRTLLDWRGSSLARRLARFLYRPLDQQEAPTAKKRKNPERNEYGAC